MAGHCLWILVWTGACYWHGLRGFMFNSSSSSSPASGLRLAMACWLRCLGEFRITPGFEAKNRKSGEGAPVTPYKCHPRTGARVGRGVWAVCGVTSRVRRSANWQRDGLCLLLLSLKKQRHEERAGHLPAPPTPPRPLTRSLGPKLPGRFAHSSPSFPLPLSFCLFPLV